MKLIIASILTITITSANSQSLPPPSRTIYKCETNGKYVYSDAPCVGAKKIDSEPTKGVSKISGKERLGADVLAENRNNMFAEAVRPITGQTNEEFDKRRRRIYLSPSDKLSCAKLDFYIPYLEKEEAAAKKENLKTIQENLYNQRLSYRNLRC
jgi:hypothetical protein